MILGVCCDLPAKSAVQGLMGHSGHFACGYCLNPGFSMKNKNNDKTSYIRYIKSSNDDDIRTHESVIQIYKKLKPNSSPINRIKSVSCMIAARRFHLIHGFAIDIMHCVYLGIVKRTVNLMLDSKNHREPYYIKKPNQVILSNRLVKLKPPSNILRRPRSLFQRNDFKANEFRGLLLYFLPLALNGLLDSKYIKHFQLLSSGIYLLSKSSVSKDDIVIARSKLNEFADKFETLYGKTNVTLNLHTCRHVANDVEHLGPTWTHTAFAFEARNGIVAKANTCNDNILHQLAWKYTTNITVNKDKNDRCGEFSIGGKKTIKLNSNEHKIVFEYCQQNYLTVYKYVIIRGMKYTSQLSNEISSIDYFV